MTTQERIKNVTNIIEKNRMRARQRLDVGNHQIGIDVKEDITVWGNLPANETEDEDFAKQLIASAKIEANRP